MEGEYFSLRGLTLRHALLINRIDLPVGQAARVEFWKIPDR
jgi:hypothetical protein